MTIDPRDLDHHQRGTLTELLGVRFVEATLERVVAELDIRDQLRTVGGRLHGGTLMALADIVGATATVLNLPPGTTTTTLESRRTSSRAVAMVWFARRRRHSIAAEGRWCGRRV